MRPVLEKYYNEACKKFDLSNVTVLDLACGEGEMLKAMGEKYPHSSFFGIDKNVLEYEANNLKIINGSATQLPYDDNSFDFVFSLSTFEHIQDIEKCLSEIKRVLKPRGNFYTEFFAIWSSICGHHNFNPEYSQHIEPWCQLYLTEEQYAEMLEPHIGFERATAAAFSRYRGEGLCRFTRKDYYNFFINSKMLIKELSEFVKFSNNSEEKSMLTEEIKSKIDKDLWNDVGVFGFRVLLEKYESLI